MPAFDAVGAIRSGVGAAWMAQAAGGLAVLSDVRTGRPGSADEAAGGDGAVTLAFGDDDVIAEVVGAASVTAEFTDRWRAPGEPSSQLWEERFGEHVYVPLAEQAVTAALKEHRHRRRRLDHVIVTGSHARAVKAAARAIGARPEALADDLADEVGNTGTAHWALLLADVLDRAEPGQQIAVVAARRRLRRVAAAHDRRCSPAHRQARVGPRPHRGHPRRPHVRPVPHVARLPRARAAAPARARPPGRAAVGPHRRLEVRASSAAATRAASSTCRRRGSAWASGEIDQMEPVRMADVPATIATFTVDRLAFSLSPPVVAAIIDFDGGGRFQCELTDVDPASVAIGDRVDDDVPPPLHERRRAQLLLESAGRWPTSEES